MLQGVTVMSVRREEQMIRRCLVVGYGTVVVS